MYGGSIGKLNIYSISGGQQTLLWTKSGTQGNKWQQASLNYVSKTDFKMMIEGTTTGGYRGDIAVDDVYLESVPCSQSIVITKTSKFTLKQITIIKVLNTMLKKIPTTVKHSFHPS
jgi:hypothetical protein